MKHPSPTRAFGPTQKDIAEVLGLSQSSVALALSSKHQHKLLPETVALIRSKAKEMGYKPQQFARMLREGRSRIIGAVYSTGTYYAPQERVKHLAQRTIEYGYQLVAVDLDWFLWDVNRAFDYLLGYAPEGVILCNIPTPMPLDWRKQLGKHGIPSLFLSSSPPYDQNDISADIEQAFEALTQHHLSLGSRKLTLLLPFHDIGYIGWPGAPIVNRAKGFSKVILEAGGTVEAEPNIAEPLQLPAPRRKSGSLTATIIHPPRTDDYTTAVEVGSYFANKMIRDGDIPDSLLCSNDEMACGAVNVFIRAGIKIPEVVKISGADNSLFATTCCIPLTTIEQPTKCITSEAVTRIIDLIENPANRDIPRCKTFPCTLLQRESTIGVPPSP